MQDLRGCDFFSDKKVRLGPYPNLFIRKNTSNLGFSLGQHPSGNLQQLSISPHSLPLGQAPKIISDMNILLVRFIY